MIHLPVSEFKNSIAESMNQVMYSGERVLLQRHGKDVAAIISMQDLQHLDEIEAMEDEIDLKEGIKALEEINTGKDSVVAWNDVKHEFSL